MDYQEILNKINILYVETLGSNLVGIYVHGSIAFKCFNWDKSDIDFIVVVNESLSLETKNKLIKSTIEINKIAPSKGLEMSIVLKEYCTNFIYPTPFDLHFSNMHINWFNTNPKEYCEKMNGIDKDLAAHFTIINKVGIVLYGDDICNVFSNVPKEYYLDSIITDIENAKNDINENPVYIILNLCRVYAFVLDELVLSKEQGGKWGLLNVENHFHELIIQALNCYMTNTAMIYDKENAVMFCDYMLNHIY